MCASLLRLFLLRGGFASGFDAYATVFYIISHIHHFALYCSIGKLVVWYRISYVISSMTCFPKSSSTFTKKHYYTKHARALSFCAQDGIYFLSIVGRQAVDSILAV